jgi:hypothetical protein
LNNGLVCQALKPHSSTARIPDALVEAVEAGDNHDQAAPILLGRAGEAIAASSV